MINLSDKPTIQGEKIILRPFQAEDAQVMEEILQDPEVIKLTGSSADFDSEFLKQWYSTRNEQSNRLDLAIVDRVHAINDRLCVCDDRLEPIDAGGLCVQSKGAPRL